MAANKTKPFGECAENVPADLSGEVESVRVFNAADGWGFGTLYTRAQFVSFIGSVDELYEGATARVRGTWRRHPRFGWQVKATSVEVETPDTRAGVRAWLMHRFDDIGFERANALVTAFPPPELWQVIEETPQRLSEVEGIGLALTAKIVSSYQRWRAEREQFEALSELGLKPKQIRESVSRWGAEAAEKIKADPYRLRELPGVGWRLADTVARRAGIKKADPRRIQAGCAYAMERLEREGHTGAPPKVVRTTAASADVLGLPLKKVSAQWEAVVANKVLVEAYGLFYRPVMALREQQLAAAIAFLAAGARWR